MGIIQAGSIAGDCSAHFSEDIEVTVTKGMVEQHSILLRLSGRLADNVDNWHKFRVGACNSIES